MNNSGSKCVCGAFFDEAGICANRHEREPLNEETKKTVVTVDLGGWRICRPNGSKCNICGGFFSPGDDICSVGQHQIGASYKFK